MKGFADALRERYKERTGLMTPMFWCEECGCASAVRVMVPDAVLSANPALSCPVCLYEAEKEARAQLDALYAEKDDFDFEAADTTYDVLEDREFLEYCRRLYQAD